MYLEDEFIKELERVMPPFFARADAGKATYGVVTPGYLAFLASHGGGPAYSKVGKKAIYRKADMIQWFKEKQYGGQKFNISDGDFGRTAYCKQVPSEIFA